MSKDESNKPPKGDAPRKTNDPPEPGDVLSELFCASCGRVVLLEELSEGSARQFAGKVFCPQCLSAKERVEAVKCKKCGAYETPIFDGKTLLCRKCGEELKVRNRVGVASTGGGPRRTALKLCPECSGIIGAAAKICGHCGAPLTPLARKNRFGSTPMSSPFGAAIVMGLVIVTALAVGAWLFQIGPWAPTPDGMHSARLTRLQRTVAQLQKDIATAPQPYPLADLATKQDVETEVAALRELVEELPRTDDERVASIEARLAQLEREVFSLSRRPAAPEPPRTTGAEDALDAVRDIVDNIDNPPAVQPEEQPEADPDAELTERMDRDYELLRAEADRLVEQDKFGEALAVWESRPEYRSASWQAKRERQKRDIRSLARRKFTLRSAAAERLLAEGHRDDAIAIYEEAIGYGVKEISKAARERIQEIRSGALPPNVSAEAARHIRTLIDPASPDYLRAEAATRLGEIGEQAAGPALVQALDDPEWYVRVVSAQALAKLKYMPAVPKLIENLSHVMRPVPERCAEALREITGQDFGEDAVQWRAWWEAMGPSLDLEELPAPAGGAPEPLAGLDTVFEAKIVVYKAVDRAIVFTRTAADKISTGDSAWVIKQGQRLCQVIVEEVGPQHVAGRLKGLQNADALADGDEVLIAPLK